MGILDDLGLATNERGLMLIGAPDAVLMEAGKLSPRPSFAPSLSHAEPSRRIAWWPERDRLDAASLSRLHWMLQTAAGEGWLLTDPTDDDPLSIVELRDALEGTRLQPGEERTLDGGMSALRCLPT